MAQRTEAICDGKTIGIESIFTVINDKQIKDENGVRWIKCEFCGKIAPVKEFSLYGGPNHFVRRRNPESKTCQ